MYIEHTTIHISKQASHTIRMCIRKIAMLESENTIFSSCQHMVYSVRQRKHSQSKCEMELHMRLKQQQSNKNWKCKNKKQKTHTK